MNDIERKLEHNSMLARNRVDEYLLDPTAMAEADILDFNRLMNKKAAAYWAQGQEIETSYSVAKKVIESIN